MSKLKEVDTEKQEVILKNKLLKNVSDDTWYKLKLIAMQEGNISMAEALKLLVLNHLRGKEK